MLLSCHRLAQAKEFGKREEVVVAGVYLTGRQWSYGPGEEIGTLQTSCALETRSSRGTHDHKEYVRISRIVTSEMDQPRCRKYSDMYQISFDGVMVLREKAT